MERMDLDRGDGGDVVERGVRKGGKPGKEVKMRGSRAKSSLWGREVVGGGEVELEEEEEGLVEKSEGWCSCVGRKSN